MLDQGVVEKLCLLRKELHQYPELSGEEKGTAKRILDFFEPLKPDEILSNLGGEGLAMIYKGEEIGPNTMIRCELDGLPIREDNTFPYKSKVQGKSHTCGHDGHMAIVSGVGMALARNRPTKGSVTLLFQPAEETGEGSARVLDSDKFAVIKPDYAFALHNLPGYETNSILLKEGIFAAASKGMEIQLKGRTSHAAFPEDGNSPAPAIALLILGLQELPQRVEGFALVTVVNALLGKMSFGTTPGDGVIRATLRSYDDLTMDNLVKAAEALVGRVVQKYHLDYTISYRECFDATENDPEALSMVKNATNQLNYPLAYQKEPFRWSEDFGQFSKVTKIAFFGVGAGVDHPRLHESVYDFPDEIIPVGISMFMAILKQTNF